MGTALARERLANAWALFGALAGVALAMLGGRRLRRREAGTASWKYIAPPIEKCVRIEGICRLGETDRWLVTFVLLIICEPGSAVFLISLLVGANSPGSGEYLGATRPICR